MNSKKLGVWLIGARGGVALTATLGLAALKRKLTDTTGLVSALPTFESLDFIAWDDIVFGGHEIRDVRLVDEAQRMHAESRVFTAETLAACEEDLNAADANIRPGTLFHVGSTIEQLATEQTAAGSTKQLSNQSMAPKAIIEHIQNDLQTFAEENKLDRVLVVNLASTEPPVDLEALPQSWKELEQTLELAAACPLPASSLYAIAAFGLGYAYINFTPSLGATPIAIDELARERNTCHAGYDGKTGETLLKSVLAPMFAHRNLDVMSWVGHNIFGNMDGRVLNDPVNKATKVTSKDKLLGEILGYSPQTLVSIEYIESLGDWKTAWDHIHFRGFLDTPMSLQFTWQGCDSILAAPLVLDLIRFTDLAERRGETGALGFLASFFKSPLGTTENDFAKQFEMLVDWR